MNLIQVFLSFLIAKDRWRKIYKPDIGSEGYL